MIPGRPDVILAWLGRYPPRRTGEGLRDSGGPGSTLMLNAFHALALMTHALR